MNTNTISNKTMGVILILMVFILISPLPLHAQRMGHRASGAHMSRSAPSRQSVSRPAASHSRPKAKPAASHNTSPSRSINGGSHKATTRPTTQNKVSSARNNKGDSGNNSVRQQNLNKRETNNSNNRNSGNRNSGNRGSNNKVNIDKSRGDVNINVDNRHINNNRNTVVRSNRNAYVRPPYRYGGYHYYAYRPYYYHPFRPFYWGPVWHPWGFFVATLATTAIIISVENQQYHYDQGVYYVQADNGYTVVQAPVGATIKVLPEGSQTVTVNETTNNYYYGGAYYEKSSGGYTVVPPTAGTTVENLPEGAEEVRMGDQTYVKYGETYYQPVKVDGKDMYEVVDVKKE